MTKLQSSDVVFWLAVVAAVAVLFFLVFDRYTYYDYHLGRCDGGDGKVIAELVGRFEIERPAVRGGPYNLKIKFVEGPLASESIRTQGLVLTTQAPGRAVVNLQGSDVRKVVREDGVLLFALDNLEIPYQDYRLTGEVIGQSAAVEGEMFSCMLMRNRWGEWRVPLIDKLMSV